MDAFDNYLRVANESAGLCSVKFMLEVEFDCEIQICSNWLAPVRAVAADSWGGLSREIKTFILDILKALRRLGH
jgi:hypothetical protein